MLRYVEFFRKLRKQSMCVSHFFGHEICWLSLVGVLIGVCGVFVELAFGFGLQSILVALGAIKVAEAHLPAFLVSLSLPIVLVGLCLLGIGRGAVGWGLSYLPTRVQAVFQLQQRQRLVRAAFNDKSLRVSELVSLFNEQITHGSRVAAVIQEIGVNLVTGVLLLTALCSLSWQLTLITLFCLAFLAIPMRLIHAKGKKAGNGLGAEWQQINSRLLRGLRNLLFLRVSGMQHREERTIEANLDVYHQHYLTYGRMTAFETVNAQTVGVFLICLLAAVGKAQDLSGALLLSYFYILVRFLQSLSTTSARIATCTFFWPQFTMLYEWNQKNETVREVDTPTFSFIDCSMLPEVPSPLGWKLQNVSFSYAGATSPTICNLSCEIKPGTTTVIVGPSGAGKSTILNLLVGEYLPAAGTVHMSWDGQYHLLSGAGSDLLTNIGYVSAESFLFEGTVYDNLVYGLSRTPPRAEVEAILESAECQFLRDLPNGIYHRLNDHGEGLSMGQKQRLSLARALLRRPRALILDEVTANLDGATEKRLVDTLSKLNHQFSIVAVTHRLELLRIADQIIELDGDGNVISNPPIRALG